MRSLISSSLTEVSLSALTSVELVFELLLIGAAAGLVVGLGFAERRRTFAILTALGASPSQLGAFLDPKRRWSRSPASSLARSPGWPLRGCLLPSYPGCSIRPLRP